jgi:hypothetical protein
MGTNSKVTTKDGSAVNRDLKPGQAPTSAVPAARMDVDRREDASPSDPGESGSAKGVPGPKFS